MTDERRLSATAVELVGAALPGAEVEAAADRHRLALTRFANSVIHQNVAEDITTVRVRVHHQGRTASGSATVIDDEGLRTLVNRVVDSAKVAPLDPGWPGAAPGVEPPAAPALDDATAGATADRRARLVRAFVHGAGGLETAGYCRTDHWTGAFAGSGGQVVAGEAAECGMSGIARHRGADGVAREAPLSIDHLDPFELGARAAAKARAWNDPVELGAGRYEVVLEPSAVADVLEHLAASGFSGKAVHERRSFVRVGDAQFDPAITITDDPVAVGMTYDTDGTPRQRLLVVDRGTTVAVTHDRRSAAQAGATSTGHAVTMAFSAGPAARHLSMLPADPDVAARHVDGPFADAAVADLVADVERGVLVSDLWYTRVLDPRTLAVTGLTRNGVWLIEGGRITAPVRNFRFTQSYAQALMPGNVLAVGRSAAAVPGDTYGATSPRWSCPPLHLASWNFTGGASG